MFNLKRRFSLKKWSTYFLSLLKKRILLLKKKTANLYEYMLISVSSTVFFFLWNPQYLCHQSLRDSLFVILIIFLFFRKYYFLFSSIEFALVIKGWHNMIISPRFDFKKCTYSQINRCKAYHSSKMLACKIECCHHELEIYLFIVVLYVRNKIFNRRHNNVELSIRNLNIVGKVSRRKIVNTTVHHNYMYCINR